uniref:Uncharacterized protein n=1 Tax=Myotis myotis TaxID=51298 RepID=A0A7J7ZY48_MYOMY|nr:hypothetical protein mMyoMyo1_010003 [Myotis myotis]
MLCAQSRRTSELALRCVRRGMRSLPVSFLSSSQSSPTVSQASEGRRPCVRPAAPHSRPAKRRLTGVSAAPAPPPGPGPRSGERGDRASLRAAARGRRARGLVGTPPARARSGVLNIQIGAQNAGRRGSQARVPAVRGDGNQSRADLRVSSSFPAGAGGPRRESHGLGPALLPGRAAVPC